MYREEVGAAFGLLPDRRGSVGGGRDVDTQLLLAGAGRGRHRRRVVTQTAAAVTRLRGEKGREKRELQMSVTIRAVWRVNAPLLGSQHTSRRPDSAEDVEGR